MSQQYETITLDLEKLYEHWQPSQKNDNLCKEKIDYYIDQIKKGIQIDPIIIETLVEVDGIIYIRTAYGRHRIKASHIQGLKSIKALETPASKEAKEIFQL